MKSILILVAATLTITFASGQESEEVRSIRDERIDTLLFGIDSQIIEVIESVAVERDELLLDTVYAAFKLSKNPSVRIAAIEAFEKLDFRAALAEVVDIVADYENQDTNLVVRAIGFISKERDASVADSLLPLVTSIKSEISSAAIRGVGRTGGSAHAEALLAHFDDTNFESNLKPEIILAFGALESAAVVESLIEILNDPEQEMTWRRYACDALGKIADSRGLPAIERALGSEDAMLRAYAISSVRYFADQEIIPLLEQGLRDSFWRVRVSAAQALGTLQASASIPILDFKARRDPEANVREEAIRALAEIGSSEAFDLLRQYFEDDLFPDALRVTAVEMLTDRDPENSIASFKTVLDAEWDKRDKSRILERTGFFLSLTEHPNLDPLYSRLLDSGEIVLTIYGIRGIERNGLAAQKDRIESLAGEGTHRSIRREAIAALENL